MNPSENRRPLKTRQLELAQNFARYVSRQSITPNQISVLSIVFAALAGLALCFFPISAANGAGRLLLPIAAALFIQGRLLCNLIDGMVAVEGGKKTFSGELFNDIPDRIADALILISAGYAIEIVSWGGVLGWLAAWLAVLTAYIRTLAVSLGAPVNFQGPMAKPHRMALLTGACLLTALESYAGWKHYSLLLGMLLLILGCIWTLYRRTMAAYRFLEQNANV